VRKWSADVDVDEPLVRRLVAQLPEFTLRSVERLADGWDRSVWLANGTWVFGFP
jgi:hypothetical protein